MTTRELASSSRRSFLTATAAVGGGLLLGFGLPAHGEVRDTLTTDAPFAPNAFLRIDRAGKVTFVSPMIEMGQGTYTSLPMLIAEELEVDVDRIAIEHSPADDKLYANPAIGIQMTGASKSIRGFYGPLRQAGAAARVMLVTAAARQWKVDPSTCRAQSGTVVHAGGRKLGYGALVDAAAKLPVPEKVTLKEPPQFKLIGTPHRRLDCAGKVDGSAKFGIDTRLPGMKFAVLAQSPTFGGKLIAVDEAKAKAVRGVSQVVRLDDVVAVVASDTFAAKQGLAAANPQWNPGTNAKVSMTDIVGQLARALEKPGAVAHQEGDAATVIAAAARKVEVVYEQPFLAHATMEPMNCTVQIASDGCDIWVGTQVPGRTQTAVMKLTGLKREQVRIHNHLLGGGFGRRLDHDGTVRAVQIAQQVRGPVQVIWTREEDIQHDLYRPYYYDRIGAGLDARGKPVGWSHRIAGSSIIARYYGPEALKNGVDRDAVETSANQPYDVGAIHVDYVQQEPPAGMHTTWWRGVGSTRGTFVVESFVDELAVGAKQDALAYRIALLDKEPRAKNVLQIAAKRSGWGKPLPAGRGRGIALGIGFGSFIAQVVEVSVAKDGTVNPTQVWCAVDCGVQVNPDIIRAQMESGIIFGLSAALYGEITIKNGCVEQTNFGDYRVLRINEVPRIDVALLKNLEAPGGIGEPGTACVMPALTNAIFAATGKRIRKLPVASQLQQTA
jgi:isoquinoline 1-oxidoreductase subunit beta